MNEECIPDLDLTTDEVRKFSAAFSDAKFQQLFSEYLREVDFPNRHLFDRQVQRLRREIETDVELLPVPGYALKTIADGRRKVYVNICSNETVGRPEYKPAIDEPVAGRDIFIPFAVLPWQQVDERVRAYTVAFHPETLEKCGDPRIKRFVEETALAFVEKWFEISLDKINVRISKKPFIGTVQPATVHEEDLITAGPLRELEERPDCGNPSITKDSNEYATPTYRIKYRNEVDLQESTLDRYCKLNALLPKQMIVEIELPLLKSIQNTHLDVQANSIALRNEKPNYKLRVDLPYEVNPVDGAAKFDSDLRLLRLELKVRRARTTSLVADETSDLVDETSQPHLNSDNGSVDDEKCSVSGGSPSTSGDMSDLINGSSKTRLNSTNGSVGECSVSGGSSRPSTSGDESSDAGCASTKAAERFLDANVKYKLPAFDCNRLQRKLAFTMHVKNVNLGSFDYRIFDERDGFWVKFCSLGGGHFPMFFAACVVFEAAVESVLSLEYSVDDEKVFVYAKLRNDFSPLEYWAGIDQGSLEKRYLNEPDAVFLEAKDKQMEGLEVDVGVSKFTADQVDIDVSLRPDCQSAPPLESCVANGFSTNCATAPPLVFDNFAKFERFKNENVETLHFETEFAQVADFGEFCDGFAKRFALDEDAHCLSESELLPSRPGSRVAGKGRPTSLSNGSWIAESKNSKKAKRQKKARDKKLASARQSGKGAGGGAESETEFTEFTDSSKTVDDSFEEAADVKSAYKFSDLTSRSILKKHRSFSESSGDELCTVECSRSYSIGDVNFSSDSFSQSVPKKTVRFNDVILKKLYSSDISILEQRKRSKRRFQRKERKASDSDNSETETAVSIAGKQENIRLYNENLFGENSDLELTSLSESGGETSDDQSDNADGGATKADEIPCSKKNHKRRGKKSARKNASTAKHQYHID